MQRHEIPYRWSTQTEGRTCGSCAACCTWLGIEELKKHTGQPCKHLRGPAALSKRCSIYAKRPGACSAYNCLWLAGWGPTELRPKDCGVLLTGYPSGKPEGEPQVNITAVVFDPAKTKALGVDWLMHLVGELVLIPAVNEVRLIFPYAKRGTLFRDGVIYDCALLPPNGYEELTFEAYEPPVGTYHTEQRPEGANITT